MGTVYLAEHVTIGKRFAVKVLAQELAQQETYRVRFLREAQIISQISHEHIVEVTDFGLTPTGSLYLVMELLEGEGLCETLNREGALPWPRTKAMVLQVCHAIGAAHANGILHRDIKPENCFRICRGTNPDFMKVLDFGLAKTTNVGPNVEASITAVAGLVGTPEYMSPERVRGETLDERSDVYAVGVLLYEMVTGCVPFSGEHYSAVLDQQLHAEPVAPRKLAPKANISRPLQSVILTALAKDRGLRYPNARALADALEAIPDEGSDVASSETKERGYIITIVVLGVLVLGLAATVAAFAAGLV